MLMFIIGMSVLYAYVMSFLHISQSAAEWIVALSLPRWALLAATLLLVVALGFFLPPVSIILMTAPIVLPPLKAAGFDLVWFGVVMTVVMEMGLIHPPVGLNIFVIRNIAPDIPLSQIIRGVLPLVALMIVAVVLMRLAGSRVVGSSVCAPRAPVNETLVSEVAAARGASAVRAPVGVTTAGSGLDLAQAAALQPVGGAPQHRRAAARVLRGHTSWSASSITGP